MYQEQSPVTVINKAPSIFRLANLLQTNNNLIEREGQWHVVKLEYGK